MSVVGGRLAVSVVSPGEMMEATSLLADAAYHGRGWERYVLVFWREVVFGMRRGIGMRVEEGSCREY